MNFTFIHNSFVIAGRSPGLGINTGLSLPADAVVWHPILPLQWWVRSGLSPDSLFSNKVAPCAHQFILRSLYTEKSKMQTKI